MSFSFKPIGSIESCYKEKFGIPRQPGLAPDAPGLLRLEDTPEMREAVRGIEEFSHLWIVFVFHGVDGDWKPLVRPPRLGGARKMGVLATRSPHRPNPIGLSAVRLEKVSLESGITLHLRGIDLLDGTPVLDIKPYIPYADSLPEARAGWAASPQGTIEVDFSAEAEQACERLQREGYPGLRELIRQTLSLDPRPAFQSGSVDPYAARILDFDVHWEARNDRFVVVEIRDLR